MPLSARRGNHDSRHDHVDLYLGSRRHQLGGICSGFGVLFGLLAAKRLDAWTAIFLATTVLTSLTGFGFPFDHLLPSHKVGIISLAVLAVAILAR
jgi:hypothetical protein